MQKTICGYKENSRKYRVGQIGTSTCKADIVRERGLKMTYHEHL